MPEPACSCLQPARYGHSIGCHHRRHSHVIELDWTNLPATDSRVTPLMHVTDPYATLEPIDDDPGDLPDPLPALALDQGVWCVGIIGDDPGDIADAVHAARAAARERGAPNA